MLDTGIPRTVDARSFATRRRVRLADMDVVGRVRLDAVARFLQDAAIDDVDFAVAQFTAVRDELSH
jgi:hypothetical protein